MVYVYLYIHILVVGQQVLIWSSWLSFPLSTSACSLQKQIYTYLALSWVTLSHCPVFNAPWHLRIWNRMVSNRAWLESWNFCLFALLGDGFGANVYCLWWLDPSRSPCDACEDVSNKLFFWIYWLSKVWWWWLIWSIPAGAIGKSTFLKPIHFIHLFKKTQEMGHSYCAPWYALRHWATGTSWGLYVQVLNRNRTGAFPKMVSKNAICSNVLPFCALHSAHDISLGSGYLCFNILGITRRTISVMTLSCTGAYYSPTCWGWFPFPNSSKPHEAKCNKYYLTLIHPLLWP